MLVNKIELFYEEIQPFSIQQSLIQFYVNLLVNKELKKIGDISIVFCSDDYLLKMNKQYLNHNYYTDIITFDYVENEIISGDLFISVDRVKENAKVFDIEMIIELYRVIFHGVLHLVGYNDKTDVEQRIMTEKENLYLSEVDFSELEI